MLVIRGTHADAPRAARASPTSRGCWCASRRIVGALTLLFEAYWEQATALPDLDARRPRVDVRGSLLRQLAAGRQGRADRPHPGAEPAHRTPPRRRADDRARRRTPGSRRGWRRSRRAVGSSRVAQLVTYGRLLRQVGMHEPVRRGLDVPGTAAAPGRRSRRRRSSRTPRRRPTRSCRGGSRRRGARGASPRGPSSACTTSLASGETARETITSTEPLSGSAYGVTSVPPPMLAPLPIGDHQHRPVEVVDDLAVDLDPQVQLGVVEGGLDGADRVARACRGSACRSRSSRAGSSRCGPCGWPRRRRRRARC